MSGFEAITGMRCGSSLSATTICGGSRERRKFAVLFSVSGMWCRPFGVYIEGYFSVNSDALPHSGTLFMLKVKGESMVNIGIRNGDQVIVSSTPTAENGDVVVVLIDNEATVKTFYKEKGHYRLQPENDTMEPIIVKECKILGKVVGLFRIF